MVRITEHYVRNDNQKLWNTDVYQ